MAEILDGTETPETILPESPVTLAEHREQFPGKRSRNTPLPTEAATPPAATPKHRAKSQKAGPEDLDEINRLTKELRDTERAIAIDRKPGESERVFELRRRTEIAKRASQPPAASTPLPSAPSAGTPTARPAAQTPVAAVPRELIPAFPEPEPLLAQFAEAADPYAALLRATVAWDRRKETYEAQQTQAIAQQRTQAEAFDREMIAGMTEHATRVIAYEKNNPDVSALFKAELAKPEAEQIQLTLAMRGAIEFGGAQSPEMVVTLLTHPELADELFLLTEGRPVGDPRTDPLVATVRRRLLQRTAAVSTGAAPPQTRSLVAPHPPTPVRTAPQTPREKPAGSERGSLRDHMSAFPPPRKH